MPPATYLIIGATGKQGGATITSLLQRNLPEDTTIRALTRNPSSPAAQRLANLGVKVVKGDVSNISSLSPALEGVTALHLVTDWTDRGTEAEVAEAIAIFQLAKEKGVEHVVFSSAHGIDSDVPFWTSKKKIEKALKESGLKWTILRPPTYMDQFPVYWSWGKRAAFLGIFRAGLGGDGTKTFSVMTLEDIGWFIATALTNPAEYQGTELFLSGDEISIDKAAETLGRVVDGTSERKAWIFPIPAWVFAKLMPAPYAKAMKFFRDKHTPLADLEDMRKRHPGLLSLEGWLKQQTNLKKD
ncbi:hypothetical protein DL96DRAFT_215636 [Flagelloscypha sp. PMI_526]|nr:hypothetical protein DL96DRAFT_215636 [Flagelloscypha sp. PMI_526]